MDPQFFASREELRQWFEKFGSTTLELWIGYHKKGTGRVGVTYDEAVLEALCYGWIDGRVRRIDEMSYSNRFTPRGPTSTWSLLNVRRVRRLIHDGRMRPPGLRAFEARSKDRTGVYRYERPNGVPTTLDLAAEQVLRSHPQAFAFFESQPPGYRRELVRWIMDARRPETRTRRLDAVVGWSAARRRVDPLKPYEFPRPRPRSRNPRAKKSVIGAP